MQRNKVLNKLKETGYIVIDDFINESYQNDIDVFYIPLVNLRHSIMFFIV